MAQDITKRERQKQRRDRRKQQEAAALKAGRRNRLLAIGAIVLLVVVAIGFVVQSRLAERQERSALAESVAGRLADLGCTEIEEPQDNGAGHLQTDLAALQAADPAVLYPERPATSGQHLPSVALSGVYDEVVDERLLLHNLEHGYANFYYNPEGPPEQIDALKQFATGAQEEFPKSITAGFSGPLPDGANFAFVSWGHRQLCRDFDPEVAQVFLDSAYNPEQAPERFISPHTDAESGGVVDPAAEEGDTLFPPLAPAGGEGAIPGEAGELAPGASEQGSAGPTDAPSAPAASTAPSPPPTEPPTEEDAPAGG